VGPKGQFSELLIINSRKEEDESDKITEKELPNKQKKNTLEHFVMESKH
jgi:hypothetical protein